jgi:tRNA-specific 2-thiouridylase
MDLCFVARDEDYRGFLERNGLAPERRDGEVVDLEGKVLGKHDGIQGFTVGQRRGLGIATDRRLYVVGVQQRTRRVVVGGDEDLYAGRCIVERSRFIPFERPGADLRARVRLRSTHDGAAATLRDLGDRRTEIRFDEPQRAITPGQAAVAYDGDLVLGGGWVERPDP